MTFKASLDGHIATIVLNEINNTTNLRVAHATNLGDQLLTLASDTSTAFVDNTPHYQVYPTDTGLRITTTYGRIDLPWRWITSIGNALNA